MMMTSLTKSQKITDIGVQLAGFMQRFDEEFLTENWQEICDRALVAVSFPSPLPNIGAAASIWSPVPEAEAVSVTDLLSALKALDMCVTPAHFMQPQSPSSSSGVDSDRWDLTSSDEFVPVQQKRRRAGQWTRGNRKVTDYCVFCKSSGKSEECYRSHTVIENGKCACPILRRYVCPICHNNDPDHGHTITHCPKYDPKKHAHLKA